MRGPTSVVLAQLLFERWEAVPDGPDVDWFASAALAIRDAVCPPNHEIVGAPLLVALRTALAYMDAVIAFGHENAETVARWKDFYDAALHETVKEWYNEHN